MCIAANIPSCRWPKVPIAQTLRLRDLTRISHIEPPIPFLKIDGTIDDMIQEGLRCEP